MKRFVGMLICLALCVGCESELPEQAGKELAEGAFVVHYLPSQGVQTRVITDNQSKGVRINSLTYLLYDETGQLEKRREIPGFKGDEEEWPLTRENMTWEQREALKDTLFQGVTYHVVFVANIDSAVMGWKDEAGQLRCPLQEAHDYKKVFLELPKQPFTDRNMFYVSTKEINSNDQRADRYNPYHCSVLLRRVVTRTDFLFEQLPVWEKTQGGDEPVTPDQGGEGTEEKPVEGEGNESTEETPLEGEEKATTRAELVYPPFPCECDLPENIKNYFLIDFYEFVLSKHKEELEQPVVDATVSLLTAFQAYFKTAGVIPNVPLDPNVLKKISRLEEIKKTIQSPEGKIAFMNYINSELEEGQYISILQSHLAHFLMNGLADNEEIALLFEQSVKRTMGSFVTIGYEGNSGVDKYLLGSTPSCESSESLRMKVDVEMERENVVYVGFNWVGFADPLNNKINKVSWYEQADSPTTLFDLTVRSEDDTFIATGQGVNEKCYLSYHPFEELSLKPGWSASRLTKETKIVCNIEQALPFTEADASLKAELKQLLVENKIMNYSPYSLEKMVLTISYPNVSSTEVLDIKGVWKLTK